MPIDWPRFAKLVHGHDSFLLTSHIRADCDALGSELGMAEVLRSLGKRVGIVNGQPTPPNLAFIDPERELLCIEDEAAQAYVRDHEVLMVLDTSAWAQLGKMAEVVRGTSALKMVLDHHVSEDDFGAELFKDPSSEATGRLVVDAADALGVTLTSRMAQPLFAAIATDTGWFRFPSTTSNTYRLAARLIEAGASPPDIYGSLYEQDSAGRVRLRGLILSRITVELGGRFVHTYVLPPDYEAMEAMPTDTEDVVNLALGVAGTEFAVILVALLRGGYKVSFRSRCQVDCNQLAQQFGGGGHRAAAGATIEGTFEEVRARVLQAVRTALG
jgi:bifunctional oligoribonuclease and PAP phosphatase NrnA